MLTWGDIHWCRYFCLLVQMLLNRGSSYVAFLSQHKTSLDTAYGYKWLIINIKDRVLKHSIVLIDCNLANSTLNFNLCEGIYIQTLNFAWHNHDNIWSYNING